MGQFRTELFIDMLILILHCRDAESIHLIEQFIALYECDTKDTKLSNGEYLALYVDITNLIMHNNIDITNADTLLITYKAHPLVVKAPELYTTLKSIINDKEPLSKDIADQYRKELNAI